MGSNDKLIDVIPADDTTADDMLYDSLLKIISDTLPADQFSMVRMRFEGYSDREIAAHHSVTVYSVREALESIRELLHSRLREEGVYADA